MITLDRALVTLEGRRGLVTGIANDQSIAWGCAKAFRGLGAELAVTYLNEKAKPHVEPLARQLEAELMAPLDLRQEGELEARVRADHASAGAGSTSSCTRSRSRRWPTCRAAWSTARRPASCQAMEISCWSFIRMAKLAEPLMDRGGALFCMTYYGSQMVVEHYNLMGPVKAALESATRYLAAELGPKGIRVHAISPGPLEDPRRLGHRPTSTSCWTRRRPRRRRAAWSRSTMSGCATAYLATDAAKLITGQTIYVDGGYHIID